MGLLGFFSLNLRKWEHLMSSSIPSDSTPYRLFNLKPETLNLVSKVAKIAAVVSSIAFAIFSFIMENPWLLIGSGVSAAVAFIIHKYEGPSSTPPPPAPPVGTTPKKKTYRNEASHPVGGYSTASTSHNPLPQPSPVGLPNMIRSLGESLREVRLKLPEADESPFDQKESLSPPKPQPRNLMPEFDKNDRISGGNEQTQIPDPESVQAKTSGDQLPRLGITQDMGLKEAVVAFAKRKGLNMLEEEFKQGVNQPPVKREPTPPKQAPPPISTNDSPKTPPQDLIRAVVTERRRNIRANTGGSDVSSAPSTPFTFYDEGELPR